MMDLIKAIFVTAVLAICIAFLSLWVTRVDCDDYSAVTGRDTKFVGGSCYVRHEDNWFTRKEYVSLIATNGGVE